MYMHRHGGDVYSEPYEIDFSANINPFGMPQSVKDAAWEGVLSSVNYPDVSCRQLKKKISEKSWYAQREQQIKFRRNILFLETALPN